MYLRSWAAAEVITVRLVGTRVSVTTSVNKVGTRRHFYRRTRPDGSKSDDVEWSLAQPESKAAPLLREVEDRCPLSIDDKFALATFFAVQLMRGPQWLEWYERATRQFLDEEHEAGRLEAAGVEGGMTADDVHEALGHDLLSDTRRLTRMLEMGQKATSALGSMHWTLLQFPSPAIATSDQPVVVWPLGARSRQPAPNVIEDGLMPTLELRIPLSPKLALLLTWADLPDDQDSRIKANRQHAGSLNAFTVAQADRQWFHLPDKSPPVQSGQLLPLSPLFVPGYGRKAAEESLRRARAAEIVNAMIGQPLKRDLMQSFVFVTSR